jgi:RNA polymerase sigma-70 factor, ECF subfamily
VDGPQAEADEAIDESQLVTRVANGDEVALGVLYDRFGRAVYSLCLRIVRDGTTAEDLTQEVFVRLWRSAASFDVSRGRLRTWLLRIAHNLALNEVRRRQSRPAIVQDVEWEVAISELADTAVESDPAGSTWLRERAAIVRNAISQLPELQRQAIELAFYSGLSQAEVAVTLGDPLGTVKSRIRVGMRHLRELLAEAGINELHELSEG